MTMINKQRLSKTVLLAAVVLAATVCYQGLAMRQMASSRPAKTVWIDIERVFEGLNARATADQQLTSRAEEFDARAKQMQDRIKAMNEELEVLVAGSEPYKKAEEELLQMTYEYRGFVEYAQLKLERKKAEILGNIYDQIREGAQRMAEEQGFDYVVVNDSGGVMAANNEAEMNRQISARRMLYATDEFDATDMLIAHMNR